MVHSTVTITLHARHIFHGDCIVHFPNKRVLYCTTSGFLLYKMTRFLFSSSYPRRSNPNSLIIAGKKILQKCCVPNGTLYSTVTITLHARHIFHGDCIVRFPNKRVLYCTASGFLLYKMTRLLFSSSYPRRSNQKLKSAKCTYLKIMKTCTVQYSTVQ